MTTSDQKLYNITLALSGIFQTAALVRIIAKNGEFDEPAFNTSISSIYKIDAKDIQEIFGNVSNLRLGLMELIRLLGNEKEPADPTTSRYVVSLFHLQRKLMRNQEMLKTLTRRLNYAISQAKHLSDTHPMVITSLADTYLNTLGRLPFRIQVIGQAKFLYQADNMNKIRALLLAGVRSAVLWEQVGGRRWQIFLWRSKIAAMAKKILEQINRR